MCNCCCCGLMFLMFLFLFFLTTSSLVGLWWGGCWSIWGPVRSRRWRDFDFLIIFFYEKLSLKMYCNLFFPIHRSCVYVLYDALNYHLTTKRRLEICPDDFYIQQMSNKSMSSSSGVISMFVLIIKHVDLLEESHRFNMETLSSNIFQVWQPLWMEAQTGPRRAFSSSVSVYIIRDFHFCAHTYTLIHSHTSPSLCPSFQQPCLF